MEAVQQTLFNIDNLIHACNQQIEQPHKQLSFFDLDSSPSQPTPTSKVLPFPTPQPAVKPRKIQWYRKFFWQRGISIHKIREWGGGKCWYKQTYINAYEYYINNIDVTQPDDTLREKLLPFLPQFHLHSEQPNRVKISTENDFCFVKEITPQQFLITKGSQFHNLADTLEKAVERVKWWFAQADDFSDDDDDEIADVGDLIKITSSYSLSGDRKDQTVTVTRRNTYFVFYNWEDTEYSEQDGGYQIIERAVNW